MLLALSLRDFVIVEQLHLDFQPGFTVLTGETGAGKSITLDALSLLLGDKADYSQIRHGCPEAQLSALFDLSGLPALRAELCEQGLLGADEVELSIRRTIDSKGRSRSFINNQAATLAQLRQIGSRLVDIHGQSAHHSLNSEAVQRDLLDAFAGSKPLAEQVQAAYRQWRQAQENLAMAEAEGERLAEERERLAWQVGEMEKLAPVEGEWAQLSQSYDSLAHAAELLQAAEEVAAHIDGDNGLHSLAGRCRRQLESLSGIEPRFAESLAMLDSIEAELGEISSHMHSVAARAEINPAELAAQEERMAELMSAARRHRIEPEELPARLAQLQQDLADSEAAADIEALREQVRLAEAAYLQPARELSAQRQQAAAKLAEETTEHMQQLSMRGARFHIELIPCEAQAYGLEQVQFQVAANQGSPLRPLNKVASGGELARISLALQVTASQYTQIPTLIFDEVDSGIGGGVAETVGRALRTLGRQHQVLAVTHLPQVAACGAQHWQVSKHSGGGQTVSTIRELEGSARIEEIARMLGGETLTDTTRRHAAEMLEMAAAE
ncbi:Recombination protein N [Eikenella corrodens]|uniref:DNA repair protein RecN n=1 Tax=Eikenella corrodens TaxID=539 RepID=A0A8B4GGK9_EIKCO|nr:DNA repair protein RecN [Eikenella corrodens]OAM19389.1 DNA repair protein RecN [Eikenella corrodens]UAK74680.1 DNA repair protein RecN [Eikenella corrodens]SNW09421.1 Recombination protein N [Eikenella corrodens]